jgi:benzylsuccinate CoA-transferase BbsF subunit
VRLGVVSCDIDYTVSVTIPAATGLLTGLKVLDLTWAAAGPVVTTFLAFMGADVVKVEHSSRPDLMRVSDKLYGYGDDRGVNESPQFNELAAGKRSIELDLTQSTDLAVAAQLAGVADVFVENMRPGKIEKLGMSYAELSAKNPGLIMCSVSGEGRSSMEGGRPGYAPIFWAEGGGAWLTGWPERPPGLVRGPIDLHAAAFATLGVLALLRRRRQTGKGGYVDCSAIEAVSSTLGVHLMEAQMGASEPIRQGNRAPGILLNDVFPCRGDDQWAAITLHDAADLRKLVDVMARSFGRSVSPNILAGEGAWTHLAEQTREIDVVDLVERLCAAGIRAARSTSMLQAMRDESLRTRGVLQEIFHDTIGRQVIIGLPWLINDAAYRIRGPAPVLGAHNKAVLGEWLKKNS